MSNLEHLIENGLCRLNEGKSYEEWHEIMKKDCNWQGNENITIDNLWEICQYVIFTWDAEKLINKYKIQGTRLKVQPIDDYPDIPHEFINEIIANSD